MHVPDGFIDLPVALAAGGVAVGAIAMASRRSGDIVDDGRAPLAGLTAAFVFSAQMVNFPVGAGTSGHLLGGVLAAVLLGPWVGAVVLSVVVVIQALIFADGGLSALGINVLLIAVVPAFGGFAIFATLGRLLPRRRWSVTASASIAAGLSVPAAAAVFVMLYSLGGNGVAPVSTVMWAMVGVHSFIGIGEAVITAVVVSAVLAVRPDLVTGTANLYSPVPSPVRNHDDAGQRRVVRSNTHTLVHRRRGRRDPPARVRPEPRRQLRPPMASSGSPRTTESTGTSVPTPRPGHRSPTTPLLASTMRGCRPASPVAIGVAVTFVAATGVVAFGSSVRRRRRHRAAQS